MSLNSNISCNATPQGTMQILPNSSKVVRGRCRTRARRISANSSTAFTSPTHERGSALAEVAFAMPIALLLLTGLLSFSVYLSKSLELTNATSLAGQYLATNRGMTGANDPCSTFVSAFQNVSPFLQSSSLTYTLKISSTTPAFSGTYPGTSCPAATTGMSQGAFVTVLVTYPCNLGIYGVELLPGCQLKSQVTEYIQ